MFKNLRLFFIALWCVSTPILAIAAAAPGTPPPQSAPIMADAAQIAELTRKADEARYAKDIAEIRADILQSQASWFEILTSTMIGLFGVLITVAVLFVTLRSEKLAIAEAKIAAVGSLADEREAINAQLEAAKDAVAEINSHRETVRELTKDLAAGEAPSDPEKVRKISELAEDAQKKPRKDRTVDDYRALVIESLIQKDWPAMERRASAMTYLFDGEADDENIAFALFHKGYAHGKLTRHEDAIAANDEVVVRFGSSVAPALQEKVAMALFNKGIILGELSRYEDAIAAYDEVVARFGSSAASALQEQVAMALVNKGDLLSRLFHHEEAIAANYEVVTRFGSSAAAALQKQVAMALVNEGVDLGKLARHEDAIAIFDDVEARFGSSADPALQEQIATALFNKGVVLGNLIRHEDAVAAYDEVVARFGSSAALALQEPVTKALFNKACALAMLEKVGACIETLTLWAEKRGGIDCDAIRNDAEFDKVRERPTFKAFLAKHGCG